MRCWEASIYLWSTERWKGNNHSRHLLLKPYAIIQAHPNELSNHIDYYLADDCLDHFTNSSTRSTVVSWRIESKYSKPIRFIDRYCQSISLSARMGITCNWVPDHASLRFSLNPGKNMH